MPVNALYGNINIYIMDKFKCTTSELAAILGITGQSVSNFVKQGMPVLKVSTSGRQTEYDSRKCVQWVIAQSKGNKKTFDDEKLRKLTLEADMIQIDKDVKLGKLVELVSILNIVKNEYATVRAQLLSLPSKITPKVYLAQTEVEIEKVLTSNVREILEEISLDKVKDDKQLTKRINKT